MKTVLLILLPLISYSQSIYLASGYNGSYYAEHNLYQSNVPIEIGMQFDIKDIRLGVAIGNNRELYYKGIFSATFDKKIEPSLSLLWYDGYYESTQGKRFGAELNILYRIKHISPRFDIGFDNKRIYFNLTLSVYVSDKRC